jgi:hypothetical protein
MNENAAIVNDKGIIEVTFIGDQTFESIDEIIKTTKAMGKELKKAGKKVVFLFDYAKMGNVNLASRKRALEGMQELDFHKMAGINASPLMRYTTNAISKVSGNLERTRHFKTKAEAEAWLLE